MICSIGASHRIARCTMAGLLIAMASSAAGQIVPAGTEVAGKTIAEWTVEWWQWAAPLPSPIWPPDIFDPNLHAPATVRQTSDVFFVPDDAGSQIAWNCSGADCTNEPTTFSFEVPSDKHLLVPVYGILGLPDEGDPAEDAMQTLDAVQSLFFSINGESIPEEELFAEHRVAAGQFDLFTTGRNDNAYLLTAGTNSLFSDGYWLMLEPLPPGHHELTFGGVAVYEEFGAWPVHVQAEIRSVVPEPAGVALSILATVAAWRLRNRRANAWRGVGAFDMANRCESNTIG